MPASGVHDQKGHHSDYYGSCYYYSAMGGEMMSAYLAARANSVAIVERLEYVCVCVGERERERERERVNYHTHSFCQCP